MSTTFQAAKTNVYGNKPTSAILTESAMKQIEDLVIRREAWENTHLHGSNQMLYGLIRETYSLYLEMTNGEKAKFMRQGLYDYISLKGGKKPKDSSSLSLKVIHCVFGDRDRRRISTYHTVLRVAIANKWKVEDVERNITQLGGVQEISLGKRAGMTTTEKANAIRSALMIQSIATLTSEQLLKSFSTDHVDQHFVAVMTQKSQGIFDVHCVVQSTTALNAALAYELSKKQPELDSNRVQILKAAYDEALDLAKREDRDKSPIRFVPGGSYMGRGGW